jgi:outer membrane protein
MSKFLKFRIINNESMRSKHLIIFFALFLIFETLQAQNKLTLDLKAAKEQALTYNRTIISSGFAVDIAQERIWESIAAGLPQINAAADYTNAMGAQISIQFDESLPPTEIPIKPTSNFNLQVGQLIFNGSYIVGIQTAKLAKQVSEKSREKTELDVISQVVEGYQLVLISRESLEILNNNRDNLLEIFRKTEPLVRVGMLEKIELDQLSVQVNSLSNAVRSAERQLEMAENLLRVQLGVTAGTELELTQSLADLIQSELAMGTMDDFQVEQNIDYQLMEMQTGLTEKQVDLQKVAYMPTLSGFYNYTYKLLKPAFDMSPPHMAGLQLSIPVFSGGERRSRVRQAEMELEVARNNRALLEEQLEIQFRQLQFNLRNAIENYETQEKNVQVSRDVYLNFRRKFEQGMISSLELSTADSNFLQAESEYLASMLEVLRSQNALNTLVGNILKN